MRQIDVRNTTNIVAEFEVSTERDPSVELTVAEILAAVRSDGDAAVRSYTQRFDGFDPAPVEVDPAECTRARSALPRDLHAALEHAAERIEEYHSHQIGTRSAVWESGGARITERLVPVDRAGLYAPGGRASYPSTVLMTVIPARVAGVGETLLCVPAGADGNIAPVTLAAAAIAQCDRVMRVGGAQAIAAMAYGTESIPRVDVIAGPGNVYVAAAKRAVWGKVGIDSFAGPSEVVIVADGSAPAAWVAADLLAQAEHGPGGTAVVVSWIPEVLEEIQSELARAQAKANRSDEIASTLETGGCAVLVSSWDQAAEVVNVFAPEHVQLMCEDSDRRAEDIHHAGAIFLGNEGSAAFGDYIVGVNHVLPTARSARFSSALRTETFLRHQHIVSFEPGAIGPLLQDGPVIARAEGLDAHAAAMTLREPK